MSLDSVAVEGDRFGSSRPESSLGIIINKLEAVNRTLTQKQQAWITPDSVDPHTGKLVSPVDLLALSAMRRKLLHGELDLLGAVLCAMHVAIAG